MLLRAEGRRGSLPVLGIRDNFLDQRAGEMVFGETGGGGGVEELEHRGLVAGMRFFVEGEDVGG